MIDVTSLDQTLVGPLMTFLILTSLALALTGWRFVKWLYRYGLPARYLRPLSGPRPPSTQDQ